MRTATFSVLIAVVAVVLVPTVLPDCSDAVPDGTAYYCYGDNPELSYEHDYRESMEIRWLAIGEDGDEIDIMPLDVNSTVVTLDLSDEPRLSRVTVTQQVYYGGQLMDTIAAVLIPLHIGSDEYTVTFMDGGRVYDVQTIDRNTLVIEGDDHVIIPAAPVKDGYTFDGWYTDDGFTQEFDSKQPVTGDLTIYAKWIGTGSGSNSSTIIVGGTNVVTFECDFGLEYEIVGQTQNSVSFTVNVVGGYEIDGDILVESDHGLVNLSQGIYTLSGFNQNVKVTITGDVHQIDDDVPSPQSDEGFSWWIIVVLAIAIVILAMVALYYRHRTGEGDADEGR